MPNVCLFDPSPFTLKNKKSLTVEAKGKEDCQGGGRGEADGAKRIRFILHFLVGGETLEIGILQPVRER